MKEAMYYDKLSDGRVRCTLCPHQCVISEGKAGKCSVRNNRGGILYSDIYERVSSLALDPIEKKPLKMFRPGRMILSVGSVGCNFSCRFCQNYRISMGSVENIDTVLMTSDELLDKAMDYVPQGNIGIAFTYNEPTIWFEYVLETAKKAKMAGLDIVLVTNGYIEEAPLRELLPFVDAMNIDLKAYTNEFYQKLAGGTLEPVKKTIEISAERTHVEVTTLVIPGWNDSIEEISNLAIFLATISKDIPLHLTRFFPAWKMTEVHPTSVDWLRTLKLETQKYLKHVFLGNI